MHLNGKLSNALSLAKAKMVLLANMQSNEGPDGDAALSS